MNLEKAHPLNNEIFEKLASGILKAQLIKIPLLLQAACFYLRR